MIAGIFHEGSGLGDQLFRYITTRTLAEDKGYEWGMEGGLRNWKGRDIFEDPKIIYVPGIGLNRWNERKIAESATDIRSYDPEINFVQDNTIIDGSFEDDKYWRHNLKNINEWLKVENLEVDDQLCIIGFRGGEYSAIPELFLPKEYYDAAIALMRLREPNMTFQVHTDDPELAKQFFPEFEVVSNKPISHSKHTSMGFNWRSARFAKYAIIPNSAFFIIPRILRHQDSEAFTIAPRYWARYNSRQWARPACYYPEFTYIHHESDIG